MAFATLSFIPPVGFAYSILTKTLAESEGISFFNWTMGVFPIASRIPPYNGDNLGNNEPQAVNNRETIVLPPAQSVEKGENPLCSVLILNVILTQFLDQHGLLHTDSVEVDGDENHRVNDFQHCIPCHDAETNPKQNGSQVARMPDSRIGACRDDVLTGRDYQGSGVESSKCFGRPDTKYQPGDHDD